MFLAFKNRLFRQKLTRRVLIVATHKNAKMLEFRKFFKVKNDRNDYKMFVMPAASKRERKTLELCLPRKSRQHARESAQWVEKDYQGMRKT